MKKRKQAVGTKGAQTCTYLQTHPYPTAAYNVLNANLRKFGGIFRHGAHVALLQDAYEHETRGWGVEKRKHAVSAKGGQTSTVQQAQPSPTASYNVTKTNL